MLQHTDDTSDGAADRAPGRGGGGAGGGTPYDLAGLPPPPDKGCPCVVLRTGFETSQGQLMKTILFATRRVAAGSDWETGVFILILLVFAAVASAFVLAEVKRTGRSAGGLSIVPVVLFCLLGAGGGYGAAVGRLGVGVDSFESGESQAGAVLEFLFCELTFCGAMRLGGIASSVWVRELGTLRGSFRGKYAVAHPPGSVPPPAQQQLESQLRVRFPPLFFFEDPSRRSKSSKRPPGIYVLRCSPTVVAQRVFRPMHLT